MISTREPLFMTHERFRRIARLVEHGLTAIEISKRERVPLHVVQSYLEHLRDLHGRSK